MPAEHAGPAGGPDPQQIEDLLAALGDLPVDALEMDPPSAERLMLGLTLVGEALTMSLGKGPWGQALGAEFDPPQPGADGAPPSPRRSGGVKITVHDDDDDDDTTGRGTLRT